MKPIPLIAFALVTLAFAAGCGDTIVRNNVSGSVSYDGKPVPAGMIYFDPDTSQNNSGPQGFANIRDGHYDTRKNEKGAMSGALVVRVEGFDGQPEDGRPLGQALFVYETKLDLGKGGDITKNFAITTKDAKKLEKAKGPAN